MKYIYLLIISFFAFNTFSQNENMPIENELIPFKVNDKWGASNTSGELKVTAKYDNLAPFFHNVTKVMIDEKYGVIDADQKNIVSIIYDEISQMIYSKTSGISIVCMKDDKAMLKIDNKEIVSLKEGYENITIVVDSNHIESYYILSKKKGAVYTFDVINSKGKKIVSNVIGDKLNIVALHKNKNINYLNNKMSTSKSSYWWSEAPIIIDWVDNEFDEINPRLSEYYGEDDYSSDNIFLQQYYMIDDFENCFIYALKQESRSKKAWAYYTLKGEQIFGYKDRVEKMIKMTKEQVIVKTYDDELNCKKPIKYGVYSLKNKSYVIEPVYYFYEVKKVKNDINMGFNQFAMVESLCENIDKIREIQKKGLSKKQTRDEMNKLMGYMGFEKITPEKVIILSSDYNLKVMSEEGKILYDVNAPEGIFIPEDFMTVKNLDSIYVGLEVFNDTYRGKGIMDVKTKDIVVKPIYEEIRNRYSYIELSGDDMKTEMIHDFKFPLNDKTAKLAKGFVKALSKNIYVVTKNEEDVAIYNVSKKKVITKYNFVNESEYPKIKTINKQVIIFLENKDGSYSVIDDKGKVLVKSSEEEIETVDIYRNKKFYFVTAEGYYDIDGTPFIK